ncbi:MAG: Crp/Fnr family transcriptional regulator [Clostridia bacterium]|nr:Crp/Fnr family transcriptional regulator [Clostridia bacterium]
MTASQWVASDLAAAMRCPIFAGCTADEVSGFLLSRNVQVFDFLSGEEISRDLRQNCWGVVLSGSVRIFSGRREEDTVLLNVVGVGNGFDIAALTGRGGQMPYTTLITGGKSRVAFVPAGNVTQLMRVYPAIVANSLAFLTGRVVFLNRRIHTLSCGSAEERLLDYLTTESMGSESGGLVKLKSYVELANRLSISRASLYRALSALEEAALIRRDGKMITVFRTERQQSYEA